MVIMASNGTLGRNRSLRLHELGVHLVSRQHLLGRIAECWPNRLPTVDARGCHTRHSRNVVVHASLYEITGGLSVVVLVATDVDILHCHRGGMLNSCSALAAVILLEERVVTLLVADAAVYLILSAVSGLNVREEAIAAG